MTNKFFLKRLKYAAAIAFGCAFINALTILGIVEGADALYFSDFSFEALPVILQGIIGLVGIIILLLHLFLSPVGCIWSALFWGKRIHAERYEKAYMGISVSILMLIFHALLYLAAVWVIERNGGVGFGEGLLFAVDCYAKLITDGVLLVVFILAGIYKKFTGSGINGQYN